MENSNSRTYKVLVAVDGKELLYSRTNDIEEASKDARTAQDQFGCFASVTIN